MPPPHAILARNEFILDHADLTHAEISTKLFRETGAYVSPNGVNLVITRAKTAGDPRALRKADRRGTRGTSPYNKFVVRRGPARKPSSPDSQAAPPQQNGSSQELLPKTAVSFLRTTKRHCKFPLHGSGISMYVCGADVGGSGPYCESCRQRAYVLKTAE